LAPTDKINIRAPHALQQDIIDLIETRKSDYKDFSDFIIGSMRKEVAYQKAKVRGHIKEYEIEPDRQEP
jgi:hypothetical protein